MMTFFLYYFVTYIIISIIEKETNGLYNSLNIHCPSRLKIKNQEERESNLSHFKNYTHLEHCIVCEETKDTRL